MTYDLQEQEHLATFRAWWDKYGTIVLVAVTAVLLAFAAWNGWRWYERREAAAATAVYEQVVRALEANEAARVRELASRLSRDYAGTAFAAMAALHAARIEQEGNDLPAARARLQWVVDESGQRELVPIARVRLAGILLDGKNYAEALKVLAAEPPPEHRVAFADRRGDVLYAQGRADEARAAWQQALKHAEPQHPLRPLIELKLEAVAEPVAS